MSSQTSPRPSVAERRASSSRESPRTHLSLDLSCIPPLSQPSPPSNTLLVTDLQDLTLFQPPWIDQLKAQIAAVAPLNSFSPLPSFRRIVCSFTSVEDAIKIRQMLDGEALQGKKVRARVYFGEPTPIENAEEARKRKLLEAPHAERLFFISPPPSPPHGWMMRQEEPPNKEVHAGDLAEALQKLGRVVGRATGEDNELPDTPNSPSGDGLLRSHTWGTNGSNCSRQRSRSSTVIYHPEEHGGSPGLPAVMVEDTTLDESYPTSPMDISPIEAAPKRPFAHTTRPPVELMQ